MRECALEMKWKVITAKKKADDLTPDANTNKKKDNNSHQNKNQSEISQAEQARRDEMTRHANVDIIWNDVTILSEKLSQLKAF